MPAEKLVGSSWFSKDKEILILKEEGTLLCYVLFYEKNCF